MLNARRAGQARVVGMTCGVILGLAAMLSPRVALSWEVEVIFEGELPRSGDVVDVGRVTGSVAEAVEEGALEVMFRDFTLSPEETRHLFLATDEDQNLLRRVGEALPVDGLERMVTFRGLIEGQGAEARVERQEDGTLRMTVEGLPFGQLDSEARAHLVRALNVDTGFDRIRLEGIDADGNLVRREFWPGEGAVTTHTRGPVGSRDERQIQAAGLEVDRSGR